MTKTTDLDRRKGDMRRNDPEAALELCRDYESRLGFVPADVVYLMRMLQSDPGSLDVSGFEIREREGHGGLE